jgi:hypothetical protein
MPKEVDRPLPCLSMGRSEYAQGFQGVKHTLSGCVETFARDYWTQLLNDKRVNHTASVKLLEQHIQATLTNEASLTCECFDPGVDGLRWFQVEPHEARLMEGLQAEMNKVYCDFDD